MDDIALGVTVVFMDGSQAKYRTTQALFDRSFAEGRGLWAEGEAIFIPFSAIKTLENYDLDN